MVFRVGRAMLLVAWLWFAGFGTRPSKGFIPDAKTQGQRLLDEGDSPDPDEDERADALGREQEDEDAHEEARIPMVEEEWSSSIMVDHLRKWQELGHEVQVMVMEPIEWFEEQKKGAYAMGHGPVFVLVWSLSASVPLIVSICLCGGCLFSRRALSSPCKRSQEAVPYIERDETGESLLSSAAYLKRSKDFKRPLTAMYIGGALVWSLIAVLLLTLTWGATLPLQLLLPDFWWLGLLFMPLVYSMLVYDGFSRWRKFFKDLPECLSDTIFGSDVPINTLDPTPVSMRPLYLTLGELWWAHHHFYLPFAIRFVSRIFFRLPYLIWRVRMSGVTPKLQPDELLAWWFLETTNFYWFVRAEERDGVLLGHFSSEKIGPIRTILNIGSSPKSQLPADAAAATQTTVCDIDKIEVWVDLRSRKAVRAQLDGVEVKFSRVATLVGFIFSSQSHAWLHAISMWGVMPENKLHSFVRKMSVATMYNNHLGFDGGLDVIAKFTGRPEMVTLGTSRSQLFADQLPYKDELNMLGPHFAATFGFFSTAWAGALVPYSRFLAFAYLLFPHFMKALEAESPGSITNCPNAYFDQTVIHCTDHWMFAEEFSTSLSGFASLDSATKDACSGPIAPGEPDIDYGSLGKGLLLTLGLSVDFPKLFPCYFRDSPKDIPFFHKVYRAALEIDPELAYHMQAAFVK